jgi:hypothetical protein
MSRGRHFNDDLRADPVMMTLTFGRPTIFPASASTRARITIGEAGSNFAAPFKPRVWYSGSRSEPTKLETRSVGVPAEGSLIPVESVRPRRRDPHGGPTC